MSKEKARQFFDLVRGMREAQKTYFRTRATSALNESKKLEKAVDDEIARVEKIIYKQQNPSLWQD